MPCSATSPLHTQFPAPALTLTHGLGQQARGGPSGF